MLWIIIIIAIIGAIVHFSIDGLESRIDKRFRDLRRDLVEAGALPESALDPDAPKPSTPSEQAAKQDDAS